MRFLFKLLTSLIMIVAVAYIYLNFVNQPRDLGIKPSTEDLNDFNSKTKIIWKELPENTDPVKTLKFSGQTVINETITDKELTARLQNDKWKFNFIPDSQIRFNKDGTVEFAGRLYAERLDGYFAAHRISQKVLKPLMNALKNIPIKPSYYVKSNVSMKDNSLVLDIKQVEIGGLSSLTGIASKNSSAISDFIEKNIFSTVPGMFAKSLTIGKNEMKFDGTFPETISVTH